MKTTKNNAANVHVSKDVVGHIARLVQVPVTDDEKEKFSKDFRDTLGVINKLFSLNVSKVEQTHQVTGLFNVYREDVVDKKRMLAQEVAIAQAGQTYNGYIVVDRILDQ